MSHGGLQIGHHHTWHSVGGPKQYHHSGLGVLLRLDRHTGKDDRFGASGLNIDHKRSIHCPVAGDAQAYPIHRECQSGCCELVSVGSQQIGRRAAFRSFHGRSQLGFRFVVHPQQPSIHHDGRACPVGQGRYEVIVLQGITRSAGKTHLVQIEPKVHIFPVLLLRRRHLQPAVFLQRPPAPGSQCGGRLGVQPFKGLVVEAQHE